MITIQDTRRLVLDAAYPIMILAAKFSKPEPCVTGEFYEWVRANIESGDVLLSRENLRMTNLLIPGFWCHVGICIWIGDTPWVVEAVGAGVRKQTLAQFVLSKDHLMVVRKNNMSAEARAAGGQKTLTQIGKPYDYQLYYSSDDKEKDKASFHEDSTKAFYCAELSYWGLEEAAEEFKQPWDFELRETLGVMTIAPNDYDGATSDGKFKEIARFQYNVATFSEG